MIRNFAEIESLALADVTDPKIFACVEPQEPQLLIALNRAVEKKLIKPVLIGDETAINKAADQANINIDGWELVRSVEPNESIFTALDLIKNNKVKGIVKGVFGVKDFLSLLFRKELGFRLGKNHVSGVLVNKVEQLDRIVLIADPIVSPEPKLIDLIAILNNTVSFAQKLKYKLPKVALMSAVEVIYPQMPVTITEAVISKMADKGQIKNCLVDGPLSMDVALIESAAKEKGAKGDVAGHADILIGSNLAVSYGIYKAFAMYTKSDYGLITLGGKVPAMITSANDSANFKYNSLLLSVIAAN